jgi:NAD(P)-dependent dehydrogenase (short-subunit alcohol dehydrogenase family)
MFSLSGKTALVTGGSRGIGAATARALAQQGADIAISYHTREDAAQAVVAEIEQIGRRAFASPPMRVTWRSCKACGKKPKPRSVTSTFW